jgi:hydrogenase nickel incorporation protein HypA/HybF
MHELSIAQSIIATVAATARQHNIQSVKSVLVEIGPLSGVIEESLRFCFPLALKGSGFEGMELEVVKQPLKIRCRACGGEAVLAEIQMECTSCHSDQVEVVTGNDLFIKSIEVE